MATFAFKFVFTLFVLSAAVARKGPDEDAEAAADAAIAAADSGDGAAQVQPAVADDVQPAMADPTVDASTNDLSTGGDDNEEVAASTTPLPAQPATEAQHGHHHHRHKKQMLIHKASNKATNVSVEAKVAADAHNAHEAAEVAKRAAKVANKVATHSTAIVTDAQSALRHAQSVLHATRVNAEGLDERQQKELKIAEDKLNQATKKAEYGNLKNGRYVKAESTEEQKRLEKQLGNLQDKLDNMKEKKGEGSSELAQMRQELEELQRRLAEKRQKAADRHEANAAQDEEEIAELEKELKELEEMIEALEKEEAAKQQAHQSSHDELKAEIEKLREQIEAMNREKDETQDRGDLTYSIPEKKAAPKAPMQPMKGKPEEDEEPPAPMEPLGGKPARAPRVTTAGPPEAPLAPLPEDSADAGSDGGVGYAPPASKSHGEVTASGGIDMDTEMPYGELEPFGREDTAQELTEASIQESDEMVDQLERAEVAEEKRAVFRALTRLRGAAITSFDGVARSQTGNIDEYNKLNKWRSTHPLHHLADEESDISKWAFPDNAD